ncbi:PilW family protein [Photobacterium sp. DNB22_13_2]
MPYVNKQYGASLVEFVVAAAVSMIVITSVGAVYLSGFKAISERAKNLSLHQDVNDAMRLMKEELVRAGHSGDTGSVAMLSGSTNMIEGGADEIGFVYLDEDAEWRGIKFHKTISPAGTETVQMCQRRETLSTPSFSYAELCSSAEVAAILPYKQLEVNSFNVVRNIASTATATSYKITLTLNVTNGIQSYEKQTSFLIRNWQ